MRRIAVLNQKGGVGKTTTTVNLAAALAAEGNRTLVLDLDPQAHATFVDRAFGMVGGDVDVVLVAFGVHGGRGDDQLSPGGALEVMTTNYLGAVSVLLHVVPRLREQGHGRIVVLSSVAGERGRIDARLLEGEFRQRS